jgi:LysM repeat protein
MGWGTAAQVSDVTYAAGKFLDQAIPLAAANPGFTPDQIAQGVQHAELGNLYAQQFNWANQLISQAAAATGKAAPGGGSSAPPPPSSGNSGCGKQYTAVSGDWCSKIASSNGISVAQFQQLNPNVNGQCTNIQIGTAYCVAPGAAPAPSGGGNCDRKYTAVSGASL